jgi:hypothetical protein
MIHSSRLNSGETQVPRAGRESVIARTWRDMDDPKA